MSDDVVEVESTMLVVWNTKLFRWVSSDVSKESVAFIFKVSVSIDNLISYISSHAGKPGSSKAEEFVYSSSISCTNTE